jgi:hypothetical protein
MAPRALSAALAAAALLVLPAPGAAQEYYRDIRPVLVENCVQCHTEGGPAFSMEDPEEAFRRRAVIAAAILDRRMPPWLAEGGHQEYLGDPSLAEYVVSLVGEWRAGGFPKGDPRPDPVVTASHRGHGMHGAFTPDLSLEVLPGGSYLPDPSMSDDYRCFVVDWTPEERSFITGFRAVPGNTNVAHHVVIYAVAPEMAERFRELQEAEEGPGYQCFGGALPDRLGRRAERQAYEARYPDGLRELNRNHFWLAHWAPGMDGHVFPSGTGIPVEPGSAVVVQLHYYGAEAPGERDAGSRLEFMTAPGVERPAFHMSQTRGDWLAGEQNGSLVIPAGEMATYGLSEDLGDYLGYIAWVTGVEEERIQGLEIHSANLHMHAFGHSGVITFQDADGRREILLSVPRWDLGWQRDFTLLEPKIIPRDRLEGTTLSVQCTWLNPTDGPIYGGLGSYDEMCFNFSYVAVQVGDPVSEGGAAARR